MANAFLGGIGSSTNINDYTAVNPQQQQINQSMGQTAQNDAQFRAMQLAQAQQLQRIASGQQQGAGELAAQRQVNNAIAAQQAQARMARGGMNPALAFRNAAVNSASTGLAGAGQAQQAALQDQINAQNQLGTVLGQGRSADINLGGQNLNTLTSLNGQQLNAAGQSMQATNGAQGILGGLMNAAGQVGAAAIMSDKDLKTDVSDAGDDIDDMLGKLAAKTYRYKDEAKFGAGPRVGIMAQDLGKSKAGSSIVVATPDGLGLDPGKAISAALAATARLHARMSKLEGAHG